jgi:YegS/Rv2252/BmrU family lipid kinase
MQPNKKYILVVNPISGDLDKTEITETVGAYAKKQGIRIVTYETAGENDEVNIRELFAQHQPERVLIAGGDGTIKMVAEALEHTDVVFGIVPAGSSNGLSVDLNFPLALEENLHIAFHNDFMAIDMISINNEKSLHLSDIGLNAGLVKNYENSSIRGKIGYALQSLATLQEEGAPFEAVVEINGKTIETAARMIVIANSQKYGTGVTINPMGKMDDGKFEIVILRKFDLVLFGKIITGNMPFDTGEVEIISSDKATITTNIPVHFQIDGEYNGEVRKLDIKILHRNMKVAVPAIAD